MSAISSVSHAAHQLSANYSAPKSNRIDRDGDHDNSTPAKDAQEAATQRAANTSNGKLGTQLDIRV